MSNTSTNNTNNNNNIVCPVVCPPPVYSKPSTSFGGNNNIPTIQNTKAFRYAQLVSLPFRARGSGTVITIANPNANRPIQPPRNKF